MKVFVDLIITELPWLLFISFVAFDFTMNRKISSKHPAVKVLSWLEMYLYTKSKRIIVLFDKAVDYIESQGVSREKVIYLPNGVDLNRFSKKGLSLPTEHEEVLAKLKDKFIAIYTGSHGLANNLDVILDAAKIILEIKRTSFIFY